ncbi:hypothetical protein SteCoe_22607 [Stentor coeruleus]|uniref:Uncharacterized protein n=1 Tax=Stentor coeruleus TaxID=5963 RepID=A0A1R2BLY1_9CILI|nr:hypothetical protein SteCoe_22607 [Stentor coeruleus]
MQIITGEFVILAILIYISNYIRKRYAVLESILRGSVIFFPPEKNSDKKNIQFVPIDDKFSIKSPYFGDAEALIIVLYLTFSLLFISNLLQLNPWITMGSSVSFYMILMALLFAIFGLYKQSYKSGISHPENILALLLCLILFSTFAIILNSEHQNVLDINMYMAISLLELQVTHTLKPYVSDSFKISIDYLIMSIIISGLITVCLYPSFRYWNNFISSYYDSVNCKRKYVYMFLLVSPLILCTLWVKPMVKNLLVGVPFVYEYFSLWRACFVVGICLLRFWNLPYEIQSMLNRSVKLVQDTVLHPSKENIDATNNKCRAIATMAWPVAHQSMSVTAIMLLACAALICKGGLLTEYPQAVTEKIIFTNDVQGLDEDEFFVTEDRSPIQISKNFTFIPEVKRLEEAISKLSSGEGISILENIIPISKENIVHAVFYRDVFEFFLWCCFFAWSLATVLNFVLINVSTTKAKTKSS